VVTNTGRVEAQRNGILEIDVPVGPLTDEAPKYNRPMAPQVGGNTDTDHAVIVAAQISARNAADLLRRMLSDTGSKEPIFRQYDHHIGAKTVFGPEHQGAAVMWMRSEWANPKEEHLGLAIATSCNERYTAVNAKLGAAHAVAKCARMIAAAGGYPLATTDCLNFGNPEDPVVMRQFSDGVDGISEACRELNAPVVSGNVSLYNETDGVSIKPTPMIGMVGKIDDVRAALPAVLNPAGGDLYLLVAQTAQPAFGGSLAARLLGLNKDPGKQQIPAIDWQAERLAMDTMRSLAASGFVVAARDVGAGGIALAAAKMAVGAHTGMTLELAVIRDKGNLPGRELAEPAWWFAEWSGCYLIQAKAGIADLTEAIGTNIPQGLCLVPIAKTSRGGDIKFVSLDVSVSNAGQTFSQSMPL